MRIAWKSIERGDVVILPESRWSCNWILHLSSNVLRQRFMLSVFMVRRKLMIGWRTPCRSLLSFSLCLMAIGFLENFPFLPKGSIESLDVGNGWSDTRSVITLSFTETVLSFTRLCVGWVSKLNRNEKTKVLSLWVYQIKVARTCWYAGWLCFWIAFLMRTINLTDFYDFGILTKEWWNFKKILLICSLV